MIDRINAHFVDQLVSLINNCLIDWSTTQSNQSINQYINVWKKRFNKKKIPDIYYKKTKPISLDIEIFVSIPLLSISNRPGS